MSKIERLQKRMKNLNELLKVRIARRKVSGESYESWLYDCFPKSGRLFLDIGANVGRWTKPLALNYEHVIAVEPDRRAYVKLERDLPNNVRVIRKAAWSTTGLRTFHRFASIEHGSLIQRADKLSGPFQGDVQVETITVDSLGLQIVDFIKIDTEGAEYEILKGAEQTLKRLHPKLLVEVHSKENGQLISQFLNRLGYEVTVVRHPNYVVGSEAWLMHYWLWCC